MMLSDLDCSCKGIHQGNIEERREPGGKTYHLREQNKYLMRWEVEGEKFLLEPAKLWLFVGGCGGFR